MQPMLLFTACSGIDRVQLRRALMLLSTLMLAGCALFAARDHDEIILAAAGDIAQCGLNSADKSYAAQTAALLNKFDATVLAVGDLAYSNGTASEFQHCYQPTWGRFKSRTLPVPGNHEYASTNAQPYFDYWGSQAGEPGKGYYATQLGSWRIIALNSNIDAEIKSEQASWLRDELALHKSRCTLAFWHHPIVSSGEHGNDPRMGALWKLLFDAGADLVITAHEHDYERFAPLNDRGELDNQRGIRQIVVGTGGAKLRRFLGTHPHSEVRDHETFGVIKLKLQTSSYEWQFIPIDGQTFTDSGAEICHD